MPFVLLVAMEALENLGKYMPSKVMKLFTRALPDFEISPVSAKTGIFLCGMCPRATKLSALDPVKSQKSSTDHLFKVAGLFHYGQIGKTGPET